jgi:exonuclease SbcD
MATTKILSVADTHIGYRQYGYASREQDFTEAFRRVILHAVSENFDAITVSGDLLETSRPYPRHIEALQDLNKLLLDNCIPCLVSVGNHDMSNPHWLRLTTFSPGPGGFHLLDNASYTVNDVVVYGQTYTSPDNFDLGMHIPQDTDLLLMHQAFKEFTGGVPFPNLFSQEDLNSLPEQCKAVVVGDIHVNSMLDVSFVRSDGTVKTHKLISPGSTELTDKGEQVDKYMTELTFTDGELSVNFVPIPTRLVIHKTVDTEEDFTDLVSLLHSEAGKDPVVFLEISTNVPKVMERLYVQFDPDKYIFRQVIKNDGLTKNADFKPGDDKVTPKDFLVKYLPEDSGLLLVASRLVDPSSDPNQVLDEFVSLELSA